MEFNSLLNLSRRNIRKNYNCIGKGSAREVFELGNGLVIKVAKDNQKGIWQIATEVQIYQKMQSSDNPIPIFCPILFSGRELVVMPQAIPLTKSKLIPESKKLEIRRFKSALNKACTVIKYEENDWDIHFDFSEEELKKIKGTDLFKTLYRLYKEFNLMPGDMTRPSSWGLLEDRIVLLDYGFTREVWEKYYKINSRRMYA